MKKIKKFMSLAFPVLIFGCFSCSNNDIEYQLPDPGNTVTDTILFEENRNYLQVASHTIYYDIQANSFDGKGEVFFAKFGKINGLADMNHCSEKVWYSRIASVPRYGYTLFFPDKDSLSFARLYVDKFIDNDTLGTIGVVVKHQYPWSIESLPRDSFAFVYSTDPMTDPTDPTVPTDPPTEPTIEPISNYDAYWGGSTWYYEGVMSCDGYGKQSFTITFIDLNNKLYSSDLESKYWVATSLKWEDYGGWRITLRGYDDGGHTSFDFDCVNQDTSKCEYHHWDKDGFFCLEKFIGYRIK